MDEEGSNVLRSLGYNEGQISKIPSGVSVDPRFGTVKVYGSRYGGGDVKAAGIKGKWVGGVGGWLEIFDSGYSKTVFTEPSYREIVNPSQTSTKIVETIRGPVEIPSGEKRVIQEVMGDVKGDVQTLKRLRGDVQMLTKTFPIAVGKIRDPTKLPPTQSRVLTNIPITPRPTVGYKRGVPYKDAVPSQSDIYASKFESEKKKVIEYKKAADRINTEAETLDLFYNEKVKRAVNSWNNSKKTDARSYDRAKELIDQYESRQRILEKKYSVFEKEYEGYD